MIDFLKKNSFVWNEEATNSFKKLKEAITSEPVLQFPNFSKEFIIEIDACIVGIGAMLIQEKYPSGILQLQAYKKNAFGIHLCQRNICH